MAAMRPCVLALWGKCDDGRWLDIASAAYGSGMHAADYPAYLGDGGDSAMPPCSKRAACRLHQSSGRRAACV